MNDKDFEKLFQQDIPSAKQFSKKSAIKKAVAAFEESAQETYLEEAELGSLDLAEQPAAAPARAMAKRSAPGQGKYKSARPTPEPELNGIWSFIMSIFNKKMWMGGAATACLLLVGVFILQPVITDKISEAPEEGIAEGISESESDDFTVSLDSAPLAKQKSADADSAVAGGKNELAESIAQNIQPAPAAPESEAEPRRQELARSRPAPAEVYEEKAAAKEAQAQVITSRMKKDNTDGALARSAPSSLVLTDAAMEPMPAKSRIADKDTLVPQPEEEFRDTFEHFKENPVKLTQQEPVSTFSIDVDTASYSFVRRQLNRGYLPQKDAVRIEELINYFDYQYPLPESKSVPFKTSVAVVDSPWKKGNKLMHIGIKGYQIDKAQQPDSNLVFLLDVSGSMNSADKLPLVKQSMALLLDTLKPSDTIAIVVYAGSAGAVLEPTPVKEKQKILNALNRLNAGGSTAGAQGITLAYQLAEQNFKKNAVNRILLATDGDFNVGVTQNERLEDFVARKREKGIYLSVLGFGTGNYQDARMQTLAQNGNGIAAYIDTLSEAQKMLVNEATSSLFPIANDVKIQVEFNPATVKEYRLIGYETRALKREDFNNDKVDAGDIGAGHSVTAIYEITPVGSKSALVSDLRYKNNQAAPIDDNNELAFLRLRYKLPGENTSKLIETPVLNSNLFSLGDLKGQGTLANEVQFATAVAAFAQILRGGHYIGDFSYDQIIELALDSKGRDEFGYRSEFVQLVRKAKTAKAM